MVSKTKVVVGLFAVFVGVLILQHIWVHNVEPTIKKTTQNVLEGSPFSPGTYVVVWSNGAERYTIKKDGTYVYEWLNYEGKSNTFENTYSLIDLSRREFGNASMPALDLHLSKDRYICYGTKTSDFSKRIYLYYQGKYYYYERDFARKPPYKADIEVYVFGRPGLKFDGAIDVIGGGKSYTKSVEGEVPTLFSFRDVDIISISFQKKWSGDDELAVVVYDPQTKTVLNFANTTASYGVVLLTAED